MAAPGIVSMNLSLSRRFRLHERKSLAVPF